MTALFAALATLAFGGGDADADPDPTSASQVTPAPFHGATLSAGFGMARLALTDAVFTGAGRFSAGASPSTFRASGRDVGLAHPVVYGVAVEAAYFVGPVYVGGVFAGGGGSADGAASQAVAAFTHTTDPTYFLVGGNAGLSLRSTSDGRSISAQLGEVVAYRELSIPLDRFVPTPSCTRSCGAYASSDDAALATRASVSFWLDRLDPDRPNASVGATAYAALDETPAVGFSAGLIISFRYGVPRRVTSAPRTP